MENLCLASQLLEAPVGRRPLVCFHPHAPVSCVWTVVPKAPPRMTPWSPGVGVQGGSFQPQRGAHCPPGSQGLEGAPPGDLDSWVLNPFPCTSAGLPHAPFCAHGAQPVCIPWVPAPFSHFSCPHMSPRAAPLHKSSGSLACLSLYFSSLGHALILGAVDPRSSASRSRPLFPKRGLETLQGATIAEEMEAGLGSRWAGHGGAGGGCPRWGHLEPA